MENMEKEAGRLKSLTPRPAQIGFYSCSLIIHSFIKTQIAFILILMHNTTQHTK